MLSLFHGLPRHSNSYKRCDHNHCQHKFQFSNVCPPTVTLRTNSPFRKSINLISASSLTLKESLFITGIHVRLCRQVFSSAHEQRARSLPQQWEYMGNKGSNLKNQLAKCTFHFWTNVGPRYNWSKHINDYVPPQFSWDIVQNRIIQSCLAMERDRMSANLSDDDASHLSNQSPPAVQN